MTRNTRMLLPVTIRLRQLILQHQHALSLGSPPHRLSQRASLVTENRQGKPSNTEITGRRDGFYNLQLSISLFQFVPSRSQFSSCVETTLPWASLSPHLSPPHRSGELYRNLCRYYGLTQHAVSLGSSCPWDPHARVGV